MNKISSNIILMILLILTIILNLLKNTLINFNKFNFSDYLKSQKKFSVNFFEYLYSVSILETIFKILTIVFFYFKFDLLIEYINNNYVKVEYQSYLHQPIIKNILIFLFLSILFIVLVEVIPGFISRKKKHIIFNFILFLDIFYFILFPFVYILKNINLIISKIFNIKINKEEMILKKKDLNQILKNLNQNGLLKKRELYMITNIIELEGIIVKNIMIPQTDVVNVSLGIKIDELVEIFEKTNFSRLPIYDIKKENILGVILAKELIPYILKSVDKLDLNELIRKIIYVPETKSINSLLKEFQTQKVHIAAAFDEFGVFSGIITLEDVLEEIVGEIKDEFDDDDDEIMKIKNNEYIINPACNVEDINEALSINLKISQNYESLAGFLISLKDDLPKKNEKIEFNNCIFQILSVSDKRILSVKLIIKSGEKL